MTARGVSGLAFVNEDAGQSRADALADMTRRWPLARYAEAPERTAPVVARIFDPAAWRPEHPVRSASRAVGSAVGRNPISFVVPCHRVLRGDGSLGGYHWGLTRKRALIGWERGRVAAG